MITESELSRLTDLANRQIALQHELDKAEEAFEKAKENLKKVQEEELPSLMAEIGMEKFRLTTGFQIEVKEVIYAGIPKENPDPALTWLRTNDYDGIIKNQLSYDFGKGEDEKAAQARDALVAMGVQATLASTVHHMTLTAFIRELRGKGISVPLELFNARIIQKSIIK